MFRMIIGMVIASILVITGIFGMFLTLDNFNDNQAMFFICLIISIFIIAIGVYIIYYTGHGGLD